MQRTCVRVAAGALMVESFCTPSPPAWPAQPPLSALQACAGIAADAARLACFDREIAALSAAMPAAAAASSAASGAAAPIAATPTRATPTAVTPVAAAPTAASPEVPTGRDFGLPAPRAEHQSKTTMIEAHITSVAEHTPGLAIFTLDNGQVWRQAEPEFNFSARSGDGVTIATGLLGSYWLSTGSGAAVRVKRVR